MARPYLQGSLSRILIAGLFLVLGIGWCGEGGHGKHHDGDGGGGGTTPTAFGVKQPGTTADDIGHSVATDKHKNSFVTGETQGNLEGNTNFGLRDIFLMKFNSAGVLQ